MIMASAVALHSGQSAAPSLRIDPVPGAGPPADALSGPLRLPAAAGERVHCLPSLSLAFPRPAATRTRVAVRRELGIRPGVRLVVGVTSAHPSRLSGWAAAVERLGRTDVQVVRLAAAPGAVRRLRGRGSIPELLHAADLFLATGPEVVAVSVRGAAVAA